MKVYSCPPEVPARVIDYANYDHTKQQALEEAHVAALKAFLQSSGYTGKHTGEIVQFPMADGYACYMMAEGRVSALVHLPYGDAWHYRDVSFLPKKEILKRITAQKHLAALFSTPKE